MGTPDLAGLAWSWIPWRVPWAPIQTRAAGRAGPKERLWGRSRVPGRAVGPQQGPGAGRA